MTRKLDFLINLAYWGAIILALYLVLRFLIPPVLPFLLGFLVATFFHPLISKISRSQRRSFASVFVIVPFWCILLFLLWKLGALVYGEAAELLEWIRTTDFETVLSTVKIPFLSENWKAWLFQQTDAVLPMILNLSQNALVKLLDFMLKLPNAVIFSFAMIVSSVLFAISYEKIEPFLLRQLPARWQTEYFDVKEFLFRKMFRFFKAHSTMFLLNYGQLLVGLFFLKSPYPLILAAVIALADLLPYIGMASILVPWGLFQWLIFGNSAQGIGLIVLAVIVSVVREVLEPRIVGKTIGLSALATLFSIYLGMKFMGFMGIFLFPLFFLFLKEWNESGRILLWKNKPE